MLLSIWLEAILWTSLKGTWSFPIISLVIVRFYFVKSPGKLEIGSTTPHCMFLPLEALIGVFKLIRCFHIFRAECLVIHVFTNLLSRVECKF